MPRNLVEHNYRQAHCSMPSPATHRPWNTPPTGHPGDAATKHAPADSITEPA
ncbi:hypothetical protein AB0J35_59245 [Nonomuraea angiospora]|uniref:hypothetical protein n=1 Tax=Nonomuraea angiospora TaxID=46172 RepID=UPI003428721B